MLKWYVDRIVEAEHQDHIQQVLKVRVTHTHRHTHANARTHTPAHTHAFTPLLINKFIQAIDIM